MSKVIEKAIKERLDRFDNLYLKATGHTFKEDEDWCKGKAEIEREEWGRKMGVILEKYGYSDLKDYAYHLQNDIGAENIEEIDNHVLTVPRYVSLYNYEMTCINQAKAITDFIESIIEDCDEEKLANWWNNNVIYTPIAGDLQKIVDFLKEKGFDKWDEGHSGNSAAASVLFAHCLIENPDLFKYMHGALAVLAGDENYHDDRSDLPEEAKDL